VSNSETPTDSLPTDPQIAALLAKALPALDAGKPVADDVIQAMVEALEGDIGGGQDRLLLGEALGRAGDPRIHRPNEDAYWARMVSDMGDALVIGRFPVTNDEYQAWVDAGGYTNKAVWSEEGWAWLQSTTSPWPVLSTTGVVAPFIVANQPVVGVTFYEAQAYATAHGARLARTDERVWVVRGEERRPYPWGAPFGEGQANTREEALNRPCAVGLFVGDRTPEGVSDLAGNVAEWTDDEEVEYVDYDSVEDGQEPPVRMFRVIHPGAWDQPSMASWAKAIALKAPESRWTALGFRLARDA
jgi:formylglycine-generating enzyme required for sulfatase activity